MQSDLERGVTLSEMKGRGCDIAQKDMSRGQVMTSQPMNGLKDVVWNCFVLRRLDA